MFDLSFKFKVRQAILFLLAALMVSCILVYPLARLLSEDVVGLFLNGKIALLALCLFLLLFRHLKMGLSFTMRRIILLYSVLFAVLCLDAFVLVAKFGIDLDTLNFLKYKLFPVAGVFIGYVMVFREEQLQWVLKFFVVVGVISAAIAVIQWIGGPRFFDSLGLSSAIGREYHFDTAVDSRGNPVFRAFSIFRDHYELAAVLSISTLCALVLLWGKFISTGVAFFVVMVLFIGLLTTYNMTAWLSLILAVGVLLGLKVWLKGIRLSPRKILLGFLNLVLISSVAGALFIKLGMVDRVVKNTQMGDSSLYYRGLIFLQQVEMIIQKPMGWGLQAQEFPKFFTADNYLPYMIVLAGVPWGIAYAAIFAIPLWSGIRTLRRLYKAQDRRFALALGIYGILIYTTVGLFSNSPILTTSYNFIFWISIGHILTLSEKQEITRAAS